MNDKERNTWKERYSYCKFHQTREDIIFIYPSDLIYDNIVEIADKLQDAFNFIRSVTDLNPTEEFSMRVVIGYRHPNDEGGKQCSPGWLPNWINIPWNYLNKQNEPLDACTHELVHPFFRCSPLHNKNEGWGDGFCDFLRGPLKNIMGLDGIDWWKLMLKAAGENKDSKYHYPAGKFVEKFKEHEALNYSINDLLNNHDLIRNFVQFLFTNFKNLPLSDYIEPSPIMKREWQLKNKI